MNNKDYYRVLRVKKTTNNKQIKRAYLNSVPNYCPNKNLGHQQIAAKLKSMNETHVYTVTAVLELALLQ